MTYKQKRRMESIVSQISAEAHLEASTLHSKESLLKIASSKAEGISALIEEKSASLAQALQDVEGLKTRLSELNLSISETAKTKGQLEYDLITKRHRQRERSDKNARVLHLVLTLFFLIAVAIAAF